MTPWQLSIVVLLVLPLGLPEAAVREQQQASLTAGHV